jgi:hypothetical protein
VSAFRTIHRFWASLMTLAVVVQIGFAGYGAFSAADKVEDTSIDSDTFEDGFGPHAALGTLIVLAGLVLLLLSLGTRTRSRILPSLLVFGLLVAQLILGWTGAALPAVTGFLHPINALIILAVLGSFTGRMWREDRRAAPAATPAASPPPAA